MSELDTVEKTKYIKLKKDYKKLLKQKKTYISSDADLQKENNRLKEENDRLQKQYDTMQSRYNSVLASMTAKDKLISDNNDVIYKSQPTEEISSKYGTIMTYPEDNDSLIHLLKKHGDYQPHVTKLFQKYAKPNSIVIDAGANIGVFTLAFAKLMPSCQVHAFEIMPKTFKALEETVKKNNLKNVTLHNIGLFSEKTQISVNYKPYLLGHTTIIDDDVDPSMANELAECTTIDSFNFKNVSFIKMDIQGCEYDALLGAKETLINNPKCTVLAEFTKRFDLVKDNTIKYDKTIKYMSSIDYKMIENRRKEYVFRKST